MTDIEHEFVKENKALRLEVARLREVAERALAAAVEAQEARVGHHDSWLDDVLRDLDVQGA